MSAGSGDLEQAVDAYWRSATQFWLLPLKVCNALKDVGTLESTTFFVEKPPPAGSRYRLSLSNPLAPGLPYPSQSEALPESAIRIVPPVLEPGDTSFRLLVDPYAFRLRPGATYRGEITVTDDASGQETERVAVWLVVS